MIMQEKKRENKAQLAKKLGVSRSSLYYKAKQDAIDTEIKKRIKEVLATHKSYGHKRIVGGTRSSGLNGYQYALHTRCSG